MEISFQFFYGISQNSAEKISVQFCGIIRNFLGRAEVGGHLKATYRTHIIHFTSQIVHLMIKFGMKRNIVSHIFNFNLPQDMAL